MKLNRCPHMAIAARVVTFLRTWLMRYTPPPPPTSLLVDRQPVPQSFPRRKAIARLTLPFLFRPSFMSVSPHQHR